MRPRSAIRRLAGRKGARTGQDEPEFLAAHSPGDVVVAQQRRDGSGDRRQDRVPGQVSVSVVDRLEMVDVEDADRYRGAGPRGPRDFPGRLAPPRPVVQEPGFLDYAERLAGTGFEGDLLIVVRAYPEKPRQAIQRTRLLSDRAAAGSHDGHRGLKEARKLLADLAILGMPAACEWLSTVTPHYLADAVTWSAIGTRLTETQTRRQLASALPMPAGLSAAASDAQAAAEACKAAAAGHTFLGITKAGAVGVVTSHGNPDCHVILRGDKNRPSYGPQSVAAALQVIEGAGLPRRVFIDVSQDGSGYDHRRQEAAAVAVAGQVAGGEHGIAGVMLDSLPVSGRPERGLLHGLLHGQDVASACADFPLGAVLEVLAAAVRTRRGLPGAPR